MSENEEPLPTYGFAGTAVRVGDTVRRAASEWSPTIQRLLTHVRDRGVTWVPAFHGFDESGREILDYIEGAPGAPEGETRYAIELLEDVARKQRQWHDATVDFEHGAKDPWFDPGRQPQEVIGHNTFADRSHVFDGTTLVGAIHFDHCYPASRLWDLAYTAYFYVPMLPPEGTDLGTDASHGTYDVATMRERLGVFLAAYGEVAQPGGDTRAYDTQELITMLVARLHDMADRADVHVDPNLREKGSTYRAHATWIETGFFDFW